MTLTFALTALKKGAILLRSMVNKFDADHKHQQVEAKRVMNTTSHRSHTPVAGKSLRNMPDCIHLWWAKV